MKLKHKIERKEQRSKSISSNASVKTSNLTPAAAFAAQMRTWSVVPNESTHPPLTEEHVATVSVGSHKVTLSTAESVCQGGEQHDKAEDHGYESATPPLDASTSSSSAQSTPSGSEARPELALESSPTINPMTTPASKSPQGSTKRPFPRRSHFRHHSHSMSALHTRTGDQDQPGQLRTLLLPEMVRAKGINLVSLSDLNDRSRKRSLSAPSGGARHRRALSLPAHAWQQYLANGPGILDPPLNPPHHRYQRNTDLDTHDEMGPLMMSFDNIDEIEISFQENEVDMQKENGDNENNKSYPPRAGSTGSFRLFSHGISDRGDSNELVRMTFPSRHLITVEKGDKSGEADENSDENEDDIVIEAWIVDDDTFDDGFAHGRTHIPGNDSFSEAIFGFHEDMSMNVPPLHSHPTLFPLIESMSDGRYVLAGDSDSLLPGFDGGIMLPFEQEEQDHRTGMPMDREWLTRILFDDCDDDGDASPAGSHAEEEMWYDVDDEEGEDTEATTPSFSAGHEDDEEVMAEADADDNASLQPILSSSVPLHWPGDELDSDDDDDDDEEDNDGWAGFDREGGIHTPRYESWRRRSCSPLVQAIREVRPYQADIRYVLSVPLVNEGKKDEGNTTNERVRGPYMRETLCEYRGRVYRAERASGKKMSGECIEGCRPRSALDRREGCWRRLKEVE